MRPAVVVLVIVIVIAIAIGVYLYIQRYTPKPIEEIGFPIPIELSTALSGAKQLLKVVSPEFKNGETIPTAFTCDGSDISPPLIIEGIPTSTRSITIIVYDPDAPGGTFYHWIIYSIKPLPRIEIPASIPKTATTDIGVQGINDFGKLGYNGPCPPKGDKPHRYIFMVLALDIDANKPGQRAREFLEGIKGHVIAYGYTMGIYKR